MSVQIPPELPLLQAARPRPAPSPATRDQHQAAPARNGKPGAHKSPPAARSGVERLRAAAVTTAAQVGLAAIEHAVVSGKGSKLRKAVRRLPPGLARATGGGHDAA